MIGIVPSDDALCSCFGVIAMKDDSFKTKLFTTHCLYSAADKVLVHNLAHQCSIKSLNTAASNAKCVNYPEGAEAGCQRAVDWWNNDANYKLYPQVAQTTPWGLPAGSDRKTIHAWLESRPGANGASRGKDGCLKKPCKMGACGEYKCPAGSAKPAPAGPAVQEPALKAGAAASSSDSKLTVVIIVCSMVVVGALLFSVRTLLAARNVGFSDKADDGFAMEDDYEGRASGDVRQIG